MDSHWTAMILQMKNMNASKLMIIPGTVWYVNIFHTNINGLDSKLGNLYEFMSGT